jgi:hypothetical protein
MLLFPKTVDDSNTARDLSAVRRRTQEGPAVWRFHWYCASGNEFAEEIAMYKRKTVDIITVLSMVGN